MSAPTLSVLYRRWCKEKKKTVFVFCFFLYLSIRLTTIWLMYWGRNSQCLPNCAKVRSKKIKKKKKIGKKRNTTFECVYFCFTHKRVQRPRGFPFCQLYGYFSRAVLANAPHVNIARLLIFFFFGLQFLHTAACFSSVLNRRCIFFLFIWSVFTNDFSQSAFILYMFAHCINKKKFYISKYWNVTNVWIYEKKLRKKQFGMDERNAYTYSGYSTKMQTKFQTVNKCRWYDENGEKPSEKRTPFKTNKSSKIF